MNTDQAKGAVRNILGQAQEKAGQVMGNKEQQAKGLGKQVSGRAQEALGDAKDVIQLARKAASDALHKA